MSASRFTAQTPRRPHSGGLGSLRRRRYRISAPAPPTTTTPPTRIGTAALPESPLELPAGTADWRAVGTRVARAGCAGVRRHVLVLARRTGERRRPAEPARPAPQASSDHRRPAARPPTLCAPCHSSHQRATGYRCAGSGVRCEPFREGTIVLVAVVLHGAGARRRRRLPTADRGGDDRGLGGGGRGRRGTGLVASVRAAARDRRRCMPRRPRSAHRPVDDLGGRRRTGIRGLRSGGGLSRPVHAGRSMRAQKRGARVARGTRGGADDRLRGRAGHPLRSVAVRRRRSSPGLVAPRRAGAAQLSDRLLERARGLSRDPGCVADLVRRPRRDAIVAGSLGRPASAAGPGPLPHLLQGRLRRRGWRWAGPARGRATQGGAPRGHRVGRRGRRPGDRVRSFPARISRRARERDREAPGTGGRARDPGLRARGGAGPLPRRRATDALQASSEVMAHRRAGADLRGDRGRSADQSRGPRRGHQQPGPRPWGPGKRAPAERSGAAIATSIGRWR